VINVTRDSSDTPTFIELSDAERQCGRENFDFYCFLIWPFIEACWLGAVSLMGLTPPLEGPKDVWIDMKKAQDSAQLVRPTPLMSVIVQSTDNRFLPARQNSIPPRGPVLLRSRQQGDTQEFVSTVRGGGHNPRCEEQGAAHASHNAAGTRVDSRTGSRDGQAAASWAALGLYLADSAIEARGVSLAAPSPSPPSSRSHLLPALQKIPPLT